NADREYLGGVIAPGLMISAEALFQRAAKLPRVEIKRPEKVIGSSTVGAMQSGLYHGYAGLVDGVLEKMIAEMNAKPRVIATGGLAPLIADASRFIEKVDSTLTLDGLRLVYERTRQVSTTSTKSKTHLSGGVTSISFSVRWIGKEMLVTPPDKCVFDFSEEVEVVKT